MMEVFGALGVIAIFFSIVAGILWIIIPFLIMGVNKRLDKLNKNVIKIGKMIKEKDSSRE